MNDQIEVRPARPEDKAPIVAFCQNTFSWGDYIEHAWDRWIDDPHGRIFVGLVAGQPVAMLHVALFDGIGWMEGMRVRPDLRRMGIGKAVDAVARAYARDSGARALRLATSSHNIPAHKTLDAEKYVRVAVFNSWVSTPDVVEHSAPRVGTVQDIPAILEWWNASPLRAAGHNLLPDPHWRWTELTAARLREQIHDGQVRVAENGFSLLSWWDEGEQKEMNVHALVGDAETIRTLALAARAEAARRGYPTLEAHLVDDPLLSARVSEAGYRTDGAMLIYEQVL